MAQRKEKKEKPALWTSTLSDVNMLLLVFFIMLFSLVSWEKGQTFPDPVDGRPDPIPPKRELPVIEDLDAFLMRDEGPPTVIQIDGTVSMRVARVPEGVVLTLGGEFEPFDTGEFRLKPNHYQILDTVLRWMVHRANRVQVIGYTAASVEDVWRAGGSEDPDPGFVAWSRLGALRAESAAAYLTLPRPGGLSIAPERIEVVSRGAWGPRRARKPGSLLEGGTVLEGEGDLPSRWVSARRRLQEREWAKDRRVDILIIP